MSLDGCIVELGWVGSRDLGNFTDVIYLRPLSTLFIITYFVYRASLTITLAPTVTNNDNASINLKQIKKKKATDCPIVHSLKGKKKTISDKTISFIYNPN